MKKGPQGPLFDLKEVCYHSKSFMDIVSLTKTISLNIAKEILAIDRDFLVLFKAMHRFFLLCTYNKYVFIVQ